MDLERIGGRHRDNSHHFAAESEALDQIAKEVRFINNVYYYPDCQQSMESSMVFGIYCGFYGPYLDHK